MSNALNERLVLEGDDLARALKRIAHEIVERNRGVENLALIGVHTRGVPLARRILDNIVSIENQKPLFGTLDIGLHRDDFHLRSSALHASEIKFDVTGKTVVLVDDVLFTGRTVRAALDALGDYGRPARVQLAVLVDRGHRELPIRADFVGKNVPTALEERIAVRLNETDGEDKVVVTSR